MTDETLMAKRIEVDEKYKNFRVAECSVIMSQDEYRKNPVELYQEALNNIRTAFKPLMGKPITIEKWDIGEPVETVDFVSGKPVVFLNLMATIHIIEALPAARLTLSRLLDR